MKLFTPKMETKRLILRPFTVEDAGAMYKNWAGDAETTKYMSWPTHESEAVSLERIESLQEVYEKGISCEWGIELKEFGQVIGSLGALVANEGAESVTVGYIIGKKWWHQGITSEALSVVLPYLFGEAGAHRVQAYHDVRNPHSGGVMKKCGMVYEGTRRASDVNNAGVCDTAWYGILKEDYL